MTTDDPISHVPFDRRRTVAGKSHQRLDRRAALWQAMASIDPIAFDKRLRLEKDDSPPPDVPPDSGAIDDGLD